MGKLSVLKKRGILALILLCCAITLTVRINVRAGAGEAYAELAKLIAELEAFSAAADGEVAGVPDIGPRIPLFAQRPTAEQAVQAARPQFSPPTEEDIARLNCFDYLTRNIFLVDARTRFFPSDINVPEFLAKCHAIDTQSGGPQVLIFHAHSREEFVDSTPGDIMTGVVGVGRYLAEILTREHGLEVMHYTTQFDVVDGRPLRDGAYERLEPVIKRILAENPSIQLVIDLHRDGLGDHVPPPVTYINGQRTARIMFVNGLSRRFRNGAVTTVYHLPNPYQRENLAFTLNLQFAANQLYPGFARRAILLPFRYSLHMAPMSILLEVGAQNNTFQEALNAMPHAANVIAAVVLGEN